MSNATTPRPGAEKSSGLGFQKGFLKADAFVCGSVTLNMSPNLYFAHKLSWMAKHIASCLKTTTAVASDPPVAALVIIYILGQAKGNICFGSVQSNTIL